MTRGVVMVFEYSPKVDPLATLLFPMFCMLPTSKRGVLVVGDRTSLGEPGVDAEITGASQVVSLPRLSGIGVTKHRSHLVGIALKDVRVSARIGEQADLRLGTDEDVGGSQLPVRRPETESRLDGKGIAARPAINPGQSPAAYNSLAHSMHIAREMLAPAHGDIPNPVGVQLVGRIKVRDRSQRAWGPGVDDLTGKSAALKFIDALRIRSRVHRFRIRVVDVEIESVTLMPQHQLQAVVSCAANAAPSV